MFTTIVLQPLFNALIFIVNILPNHDLWIALVIITVLFKLILIPAFKKQSKDQIIMQHLAPKMKALQEKLKDKREDLAKETMAMYSKYKINPFTSIFILLIQIGLLMQENIENRIHFQSLKKVNGKTEEFKGAILKEKKDELYELNKNLKIKIEEVKHCKKS